MSSYRGVVERNRTIKSSSAPVAEGLEFGMKMKSRSRRQTIPGRARRRRVSFFCFGNFSNHPFRQRVTFLSLVSSTGLDVGVEVGRFVGCSFARCESVPVVFTCANTRHDQNNGAWGQLVRFGTSVVGHEGKVWCQDFY